ncbi:MAG: hypothetical protein HQL23_06780 [Candidatus Omnitrophica bacterium]|nr:hypothetical protein [Candidatus Omnitrophota bacterium]
MAKLSDSMGYISKKIGRAVKAYDMLHDGDKVILAVSGGKDSLTLVDMMLHRQKIAPIDFELMAVYIDMDAPNFPQDRLRDFFVSRQIPYHFEKIDMLQGKTWEEINCFWCSWSRRKALFRIADRFGFNKIAFGHHLDDVVETVLLNLFFRGEIGAMRPKQELFQGRITLIRPLAFVEESAVAAFFQERGLPDIDKHKCPNNDRTQRMRLKKWLSQIEAVNPAVKKNIYNALKNIKSDYLL